MFTAALALAVAAAAPTKTFGDVFSIYDYPETVLREHRGGTVGFRLLISDKGIPTGCEVIHSTGWEDLDVRTCGALIARARFNPAIDAMGRPTPGTYLGYTTWSIPGRNAKGAFDAPKSELTVTIAQGPKAIKFPATALVAVIVNSTGVPSDCTPVIRNPSSKDLEAEQLVRDKLGGVACTELLRTFQFRPMFNREGQPIGSVQTARILFQLAP